MSLTFSEYQERSGATDMALEGLIKKYPDLPEEVQKLLGIAYAGLGLGESGEIQNNIKKMIRDDQGITEEKIEKVEKEVGDLMWYIAKLCRDNGLSMAKIAQANLDKLASRKERGVITGSGDDR